MTRTFCVAAAALSIAAMRMAAHHAFASEYDENKRVAVSGTVTRFEWVNPHAWLYVDAKDGLGKVAVWSFEMGSPGGLGRRGWTKTALKRGDRVTVEGFGAKDGSNRANAGNVTMPGSGKLFGGFQTTPGAPVR
jgi:predicted small integral membrane protein